MQRYLYYKLVLTVSTPANITSIAMPLTSSGVNLSFESKYVNRETTVTK